MAVVCGHWYRVMALVGWVFYRNGFIIMIASVLGLFYPVIKRKSLSEKRCNILRVQFKDLLYYLGAALSAGKSVEHAFIHAHEVLKSLYPGKKSDIVLETELIIRRLQMNENIEGILKDFAVRSEIEEIHHFADVFGVCKRTGKSHRGYPNHNSNDQRTHRNQAGIETGLYSKSRSREYSRYYLQP